MKHGDQTPSETPQEKFFWRLQLMAVRLDTAIDSLELAINNSSAIGNSDFESASFPKTDAAAFNRTMEETKSRLTKEREILLLKIEQARAESMNQPFQKYPIGFMFQDEAFQYEIIRFKQKSPSNEYTVKVVKAIDPRYSNRVGLVTLWMTSSIDHALSENGGAKVVPK